jgi:hypothetical protein
MLVAEAAGWPSMPSVLVMHATTYRALRGVTHDATSPPGEGRFDHSIGQTAELLARILSFGGPARN